MTRAIASISMRVCLIGLCSACDLPHPNSPAGPAAVIAFRNVAVSPSVVPVGRPFQVSAEAPGSCLDKDIHIEYGDYHNASFQSRHHYLSGVEYAVSASLTAVLGQTVVTLSAYCSGSGERVAMTSATLQVVPAQ